MSNGRATPGGPEKAIGAVVLSIGLGALAVLAFAARKVISLNRAVDIGDVLVLGILAAFGSFCVILGWLLIRSKAAAIETCAREPAPRSPAKRVSVSHGCAAIGVVLVILSVLLPAHWYPIVFFFAGLALLAISHGLTPCVERLEQLRKARASERQL